MKHKIALVLILAATSVFAQKFDERLDLRFGMGFSFLGSGDMSSLDIENELNYKINSHFWLNGQN